MRSHFLLRQWRASLHVFQLPERIDLRAIPIQLALWLVYLGRFLRSKDIGTGKEVIPLQWWINGGGRPCCRFVSL